MQIERGSDQFGAMAHIRYIVDASYPPAAVTWYIYGDHPVDQ